MCYNILCDKYCTRQLYGYCPPWALSWDYRKKMILDEVQQYNADIVSLQVNFAELCVLHGISLSTYWHWRGGVNCKGNNIPSLWW